MSALRLRASLSLLLLLGGCVLSAVRRDKGRAGSAAELALGPAGPSSGRFVSPERHACSWQLLLPGPRPAAGSELALRCQGPAGTRLHCAYRGEPESCAAYAARRGRFWKQVLSRLRRMRRPCHDPAPLTARLCNGKKGRGAKLRLVRDGNVITQDATIESLRREKDDANEVAKGYECGMVLSYPDIQVGDIIQTYEMVEVPRD